MAKYAPPTPQVRLADAFRQMAPRVSGLVDVSMHPRTDDEFEAVIRLARRRGMSAEFRAVGEVRWTVLRYPGEEYEIGVFHVEA